MTDFKALLRALADGGVVYRRSHDNIERLVLALTSTIHIYAARRRDCHSAGIPPRSRVG